MSEKRKMLVVTPNAQASVMQIQDDRSAFKSGPIDYTCGKCGRVLLEGLKPDQVNHLVFLCPCGAHNVTAPVI